MRLHDLIVMPVAVALNADIHVLRHYETWDYYQGKTLVEVLQDLIQYACPWKNHVAGAVRTMQTGCTRMQEKGEEGAPV